MKYNIATLICVYGGDNVDHLSKSLDSIFAQSIFLEVSCRHVVFLHIDGAIDDLLRSYIQTISKIHSFVIVESALNIGLGAGLNKLMSSSLFVNFDYAFRMDADDISVPSRYYKQFKFLKQHPEIAVLGTSIYEFSSTEDGIEKVNIRIAPTQSNKIKFDLCYKTPIYHPTVCFNLNNRVISYLKYPDGCFGFEDLALWHSIILDGGNFGNLEEPLLFFRYTSETLLRRSSRKKITSEFFARSKYTRQIKGIKLYLRIYFIFFALLRTFGQMLPIRFKANILKHIKDFR